MTAATKQPSLALELANRVRGERAKAKGQFKNLDRCDACEWLKSILREPGIVWLNADLIEVLTLLPGVGRRAATRFLRCCEPALPENKKIADLTARQTDLLSVELERWADR